MKRLLLFAVATMPILLSACGSIGSTPAGGVTQSESDALNDAAAVIDESNKAVADGAAAKPK
jgi:protein involved in sex pheromone biosynthesis